MNTKNTRQKSRNDLIKEYELDQKTEQPSSLHEIKNLSKNLIELTQKDLETFSILINYIYIYIFKRLIN